MHGREIKRKGAERGFRYGSGSDDSNAGVRRSIFQQRRSSQLNEGKSLSGGVRAALD